MKYELLIGRRYLRSSRGNRFVSFISTISMAGVAIGVAVLIVVLSVMNGFEREGASASSVDCARDISALSFRLGDGRMPRPAFATILRCSVRHLSSKIRRC